jgi:hypothetical protein
MSQTLNTVPAFEGTNYDYLKARMRFFLKSIDCWSIVVKNKETSNLYKCV